MALQDEQRLVPGNVPLQRKTTLKWQDNGELSEIDMTRIISRLNNSELTGCDLTCEIEEENKV
tara:strand:- start:380 stop:568 length:189 start_codon:yes stop_codon:yes gene_type:complete